MPTARQTALILLLAFASVPDSAAFAGMALLSGSHRAFVGDIDGADSERLLYTTPGVPFEGTASANYRMLTAEGVFSTFFDTNLLTSSFASIQSVAQTTQESPSEFFSAISTMFWFTTDMDVEVSVQGSMAFDLGTADSGTAMVLAIFDGNQDRIYQSTLGSSVGIDAGVFLFEDSTVLEGGTAYFVTVSSNLSAAAYRNPGPPSTVSGDIALVITTVPEPTSIFLLCCGALLVRLGGGKAPSFSGGSTRHHP